MTEALSFSEANMAHASASSKSLASSAGDAQHTVSLLGSDYGGIRLDLLILDNDEAAFPFSEAAPAAADQRHLSALLILPNGKILSKVRLGLQVLSGDESPEDLRRSDSHWQARARWVAAHPDIPPMRFVVGDVADESGLSRLAPRLFCRARQRIFRPRSPISLQPLVTCRDDSWLTRHQVPARTAGGLPVLYSPADKVADQARFYAEQVPADADSSVIGDLDQCLLDQGEVAAELEKQAPAQPQLAEQAQRDFPCYRCPSHGECYPQSGFARARERLVPVNFNDAVAIATLCEDADLGTYAEALHTGAVNSISATADTSHRDWLHEDRQSDGWLTECVLLQCTLLAELAELVTFVWERYEHGLGQLSEHTVGVHLDPSGGITPRFWTASIGLHGIEAAATSDASPEDPQYALRRRLAHAPGSEFRGQGRLTLDPIDGDQTLIMGWLTAPMLRPILGLGDELTLELRPTVETTIPLSGIVIGFVGDVLQIELQSAESSPDDIAALGGETCEADYHFQVGVSVADDLYALGVLILRCLWCGPQRSLSDALVQLEQLGQKLSNVVGADERLAIIDQDVRQGNWKPAAASGIDPKRSLPEPVVEALAKALSVVLTLTGHTSIPLDLSASGSPLGVLQGVADLCVALRRRLESAIMPAEVGHQAHAILAELLAEQGDAAKQPASGEEPS
jgi:hypothetical protein